MKVIACIVLLALVNYKYGAWWMLALLCLIILSHEKI